MTAAVVGVVAPILWPRSERSGPLAEVRFNSLGGSTSPFIAVYRGPNQAPEDREVTGSFKHGQTVMAECKTEGRRIDSKPEFGEEQRSLTSWVRLTQPELMYATLTYADIDEAALEQLPSC